MPRPRVPFGVRALSGLFALSLFLASPVAAAGSPSQPDVVDDGVGEAGLPTDLNVLSGWVAGETATGFSLFMKIQSLGLPPAGAFYMYHFHFQVERTDGTSSLYHGMVHHLASGAWMRMVQHWITIGGEGTWGATNDTGGTVDASQGVLEVEVHKAWVEGPKSDIATGHWSINSFYIHADRVNASTQAVEATDSAPAVGTMGSATLSLGAPAPLPTPSAVPALAATVIVVGAGTAIVLVQRRR